MKELQSDFMGRLRLNEVQTQRHDKINQERTEGPERTNFLTVPTQEEANCHTCFFTLNLGADA